MATYLYQHPVTKKVVEITQSTKDKHEYTDSEGVKYDRVWTIPQTSFNQQLDPFSSKSFVDKTRGKKLSVGDLWDMSAEMSDKRAGNSGKDEVKMSYEKKETEKRKGKKLSSSDTRDNKKR